MGCDIHCYAEVKTNNNGKWKEEHWAKIGAIFKNEWSKENNFPDDFYQPLTDKPIDCRNYDLFSLLANVRNGTWGEEIKPISQPRGLPHDVSYSIKELSEEFGEDGHSHSYLYLEELENFDWKSRKIKHSAYVSKEQKEAYEIDGIKPSSYSAWSSTGVVLDWEETYYEGFAKGFVDNILPQLKELKKWGKVRIVFWFDN
jgi:hypothetical protein